MVLSLIEVRLTYIIPSKRCFKLNKGQTYVYNTIIGGGFKLNRGQTYVYITIIGVVLSLIKVRLKYILPSQRWF